MKLKLSKKKIFIILGVGLLLFILGGSFFSKKDKNEYTTAEVKRGNLIQTVSEVGTVKANKELELNFAQPGKLSILNVKIGDQILKDQVLAELDNSSLNLREKEAIANLTVAQANLNKLIAGATREDLAIYEAQSNQARVNYLSALEDYNKSQSSLEEALRQAQDRVDDLNSNLPSDITPREQAVTTAEINLDNAKSLYGQAITNARNNLLITADSKLSVANTALDYVNRILSDDELDGLLSVENTYYLTKTREYYNSASLLKVSAQTSLSLARVNSSDANLDKMTADILDYSNETLKALNNCFSALENSVISSTFTQSELETFKTNINTHISYVSTAISSLQSADYSYDNSILTYNTNVASAQDSLNQAQVNLIEEKRSANNALATAKTSKDQQLALAQAKVDTSKEAFEVAQRQLLKAKSPARSEDISLAQAQVSQAEANLSLIRRQKIDNSIVAPIDGKITKINYEIGEQVSSAKPVIVLLSENNFEVEVDISEADISKVKLNDPTTITLDAFGEARKFQGSVYFIEPASTVISDVIYYKVKIKFTDEAEKLADVKAGMTANAVITTAERQNVIYVPNRAVVEKNGSGKYVRVLLNGKKVEEIAVRTGLSDNEGRTEIVSGALKEGDQAITFVKEAK